MRVAPKVAKLYWIWHCCDLPKLSLSLRSQRNRTLVRNEAHFIRQSRIFTMVASMKSLEIESVAFDRRQVLHTDYLAGLQ